MNNDSPIATCGGESLTSRVSTLMSLAIPQPLCDFFSLEGPVFELQVTIEQLGDFFRGARFLDLVQRP